MNTGSIGGGHNQSVLLQQLMNLAQAADTDSDEAANSAGTLQVPASAAPPGAPPAASGTPSDMFSADTLSALTSAQAGAADPLQQMASNMAGQMVSQLDTDSDGGVSLSEVQTALGSNAASSSDGLAGAFAQLDTNGDGSLSAGELTTGLQQMGAQAAGSQGVHGHHGHHGHHGPPPTDDADAADPASDPDPSIATAAASSSAGAASSPSSTAPTADALQTLMAQLTQYQYASLTNWAQDSKQTQSLTA